jgi:threonine aldolase
MNAKRHVVDLRSDFLSSPSEAMIDAMNAAARSPGGFGLRENLHVRALETKVATLLNKEDALFCPTCTMANQVAINVHCSPGDAVVAETSSHIFTSEAGAPGALSGVNARPIEGQNGRMDDEALANALTPSDALRARVSLVVLENTHVRSGGQVIPIAAMRSHHAMALQADAAVHLDGARLVNAALALNVELEQLSQYADSVSLSLNKSLGAPLGAALAGTREFITEAVRVRQRFGGGWRPAGIPAAAALVALDHWRARLAADHQRARTLAAALTNLQGVSLEQPVMSNLLVVQVQGMTAHELAAKLDDDGIRVIPFSANGVRLAIYHDINDQHIERVAYAFDKLDIDSFT